MPKIQIVKFKTWSDRHLDADAWKNGPEEITGKCGVFMDRRRSAQPKIHVFAVDTYSGNEMLCNGPLIFEQILDEVLPSVSLHEASWSYTNGPYHSDVVFEGSGKITTRMIADNEFAFYSSIPVSETLLPEYEQKLTENFSGQKMPSSPQAQRIVVPIPRHPQKYLCMEDRNDPMGRAIFADTEKLLRQWYQDNLPSVDDYGVLGSIRGLFGIKSQGDLEKENIQLMGTTLEQSIRHVYPHNGSPHDAPRISYNPRNDGPKIGVTNGRHRIVNLAKLGAPFIPVDMQPGPRTEEFRKHFEWRSNSPEARPFDPAALFL